MNILKKQTGQFTIGLGIVLATVTFATSGVVGYFTSNITVREKISEVEKSVVALEANEENITEWLKRIEKKLDRVIENN